MEDFDLKTYTLPISIQQKLEKVEALALTDPVYRRMLSALGPLEERFSRAEETLPPELRDLIWDYFGMSEAMTHRLLELACLNMEFPGSEK